LPNLCRQGFEGNIYCTFVLHIRHTRPGQRDVGGLG
jgi:hypothetical protein